MPTPLDEDNAAARSEEDAIDKVIDSALSEVKLPEGTKDEPPKKDEPADEPPAGDAPAPAPEGEAPAKPAPKEDKPADEPAFETEAELQTRLDALTPEKNAKPEKVRMAHELKSIIAEKDKLARKALADLKAEREEKGKIKPLTPELEAQLEELKNFRRMYGIEQDPVLAQKYDAPISGMSQNALKLLSEWGAKEAVTKFISENGGVSEFLTSKALMPDGKTKKADWFDEEIYGAMSGSQKREFDLLAREIQGLSLAKRNEIGSAKQDASKWEAQRQQEIDKQKKTWETRLLAAKEKAIKDFGPDAMKKDIPVTATPEEKARLTEHNKNIEAAEKVFEVAMKANTPEEVAQIGVLAGYSQYLYPNLLAAQEQLKSEKTRADELQKKLDAISKAGRTAKQSNAPLQPAKAQPTNKLEKNDGTAIDAIMDDVL